MEGAGQDWAAPYIWPRLLKQRPRLGQPLALGSGPRLCLLAKCTGPLPWPALFPYSVPQHYVCLRFKCFCGHCAVPRGR